VQHIWFGDDVFALNHHWVQDFANEIEAMQCALPFKIQSRADLMTHATVAALKRAGCAEIWMGVESGSQKVLNAMDKGLRVSDVVTAREHLGDEGIRACYFLQFGYPGETWEDIQQTIALVRRTRPDDIGISFSYPLPGTLFYERVQEQIGAKRNWTEMRSTPRSTRGEMTTHQKPSIQLLSGSRSLSLNRRAGTSKQRPSSKTSQMRLANSSSSRSRH